MHRSEPKPLIAITMGDPRGIGPEVVVKALAHDSVNGICRPLVVGDAGVLTRTVSALGLALQVREAGDMDFPWDPGVLSVLPYSDLTAGRNGTEFPANEGARASFTYVEKAARMVLNGEVGALVTGPVSKHAIYRTGVPFQGHTEYLAELSGTKDFVMMLAGEQLRIALVTTHVPLRKVPELLHEEQILSVIAVTDAGLRDYFGISKPRIGTAAFNPHGGEGGLFGDEEIIITRAVERARDREISATGPWPADTLFYRSQQGEFDAVVCMYHDQGLIPLKLLHFDSAVNVTLGLPFIRTSVDHGVAYDIAGRGLANPRSMEAAIRLAAEMARIKQRRKGETA